MVNTLDAVAPTTTVVTTDLGNDSFEATWTATDDPLGSGILDHTVFVSIGGGAFFALQRAITETSVIFDSEPGLKAEFIVLSRGPCLSGSGHGKHDASGPARANALGIRRS